MFKTYLNSPAKILKKQQWGDFWSHSQVLELLQGLLRREHIDQTDDLQAQTGH